MRQDVAETLSIKIGESIDAFVRVHPDLTVVEVLAALERVRFIVTESYMDALGNSNVE